MMKNIFIKTPTLFLAVILLITSCVDMDIPPKNMVTEEVAFNNEAGITAYFANLYSQIPMMDKRYSVSNRYNNNYVTEPFSCITGEAIGRDQKKAEVDQYWNGGYEAIRAANILIETLPNYAQYHSEEDLKHWLGEAHFIRASVYTAFAQRYGGISLVTRVLNYPEEDIETFKIPRSSESDTWKQIESDYQYAIDNCKASSSKTRINKYTAAAYKASTMLFAASIAKWNIIEHYDTERDLRLCGISEDEAVYFYKSAYNATKVFDGSSYQLHRGDWVEGDKNSQFINFHNIHQKPDNAEVIFMRDYLYLEVGGKSHSWDALYGPLQLRVDGLSGGVHPTLEFVELFDGIEKDVNGQIQFLNSDGTHIMYDKVDGPYENVEPRLRATVILPNDEFKGEIISIYRGIYEPIISAEGLLEMYTRDQIVNCSDNDNLLQYTRTQVDAASPPLYTKLDGTKMEYAGLSGSYSGYQQGTSTGFLLRKNLDSELEKEYTTQNRGDAPWVDMRYAEVLLTKAEAAFELAELGDSEGSKAVAAAAIDDIRKRAGCINFYDESSLTRQIIRDEFIRELAFENKAYWNLIRWRELDKKHASAKRYNAALPIYAGTIDKWFYIVKATELAKTLTFNPMNYYLALPDNQISANPNIVQNPK